MNKRASFERIPAINKALRLHGLIARHIGVAIMSGKYLPGDLLTGEIASSEHLKVSRTAYREAVRILAAKGLVEAKPKVGTKVNSRDKWQLLDPDVLAWAFEKEPDVSFLSSLFELRNIVESAAASLAAMRRTKAQLKSMQRAVEGMRRFTLANEAGRKADLDFHETLLRATNNPFIISLTTGVNAAISTTTTFKQRNRPLPRDPVPDHIHVLEAIAEKNPVKAQKAMSELIRLALQDIPVSPRSKKSRSGRKAK